MFESIIGLAGLGMQLFGGMQAANAQSQAAHAMAEAAYQDRLSDWDKLKQMNLDADRQRRDVVRKSIAARSMALTAAVSNGGGVDGNSALEGAYGGIQESTTNSLLGINQNQGIATDIAMNNSRASSFYAQAGEARAKAANSMALSSLGGAIMGSAGTIARVGTFGFGRMNSFASSLQTQNGVDLQGGIWPA